MPSDYKLHFIRQAIQPPLSHAWFGRSDPNIPQQYGITNRIEMASVLAAWDAAKPPLVLEQ